MNDRIAEIKARSEAGIDYKEDVPFLLGEIERLKMMFDAAAAGQETMQKQWAADVAERDAAVADLREAKTCESCLYGEDTCERAKCEWEWRGRGVQK